MNVHNVEAYVGAVLGFSSLAAAALDGPLVVRLLEAGAGIVVLALTPFVWLESRKAVAALFALSVALLADALLSLGRGAPSLALAVSSGASAVLGGYLLALKRRRLTHPLDLPVYG